MNTDFANFRAWYVDTLTQMYPRRESGIAVFMLSLPLLERFLRQKNRLTPSDNLTDACMKDMCVLFEALSNERVAWQFWNVYRNGFLHQATLSLQTKKGASLPVGWLSHDKPHSVAVEIDGSFWVHPVLFSQRVIQAIEQNFAIYSGSNAPLPTVSRYGRIPEPPDGRSYYLGTGVSGTQGDNK